LGDTEDTWKSLFGQMGGEYHPPRLVLFRGAVDSACGLASSAVGPFYCSVDSHVYLDRSFFEALGTYEVTITVAAGDRLSRGTTSFTVR
jgi:predicted metalloprotease